MRPTKPALRLTSRDSLEGFVVLGLFTAVLCLLGQLWLVKRLWNKISEMEVRQKDHAQILGEISDAIWVIKREAKDSSHEESEEKRPTAWDRLRE